MKTLFLSALSLFFMGSIIAQNPQAAVTQKEKTTVYEDYHANGSVAQRGYLKQNKPHGIWESFNADGQLVMQGRYVDGQKEGTWLFWQKEGLIQVEYKANKKQSYLRFAYEESYVEK